MNRSKGYTSWDDCLGRLRPPEVDYLENLSFEEERNFLTQPDALKLLAEQIPAAARTLIHAVDVGVLAQREYSRLDQRTLRTIFKRAADFALVLRCVEIIRGYSSEEEMPGIISKIAKKPIRDRPAVAREIEAAVMKKGRPFKPVIDPDLESHPLWNHEHPYWKPVDGSGAPPLRGYTRPEDRDEWIVR